MLIAAILHVCSDVISVFFLKKIFYVKIRLKSGTKFAGDVVVFIKHNKVSIGKFGR